MQLLGGDEREALRQIKPHLVPKHRKRARARAVSLGMTVGQNMSHEIEILFHP